MEFNIIFKTARRIVIELLNEGIYNTKTEYDIYLNGKMCMTSNRTVQSIGNLLPNTKYTVQLKTKSKESEIINFTTDKEFVTLNVKRFGAKGDGITDDTQYIQAAIQACPKDGRVYIPEGVYKIKTLYLKDDLILDLAKGAELSASTNPEDYAVFPGLIESYDEQSEYNLGSWEGNPLDMFTGVITGVNVSNVIIMGEGIINGNGDYDNWWQYPIGREALGAFRPRLVFLNNCKNITMQGITAKNSPSWNLHPYFSENLRFIDIKIFNPKDSPNTDGLDPESCKGIEVVGVYFSLGDDCIAIKSGKLYMGKKYKVPSSDIDIRQSWFNEGHGAVTIGSEMAAGVKNLRVKECLFTNTDRGLRIKTRRGRGEDAVVENIYFENILMDGVLTPFVVNSFYNCCDPDAHSEYVRTKEKLPIDDRTPHIKKLEFKNIECQNAHVAGIFLYGLPERKIDEVIMENITIDYAENPIKGIPAMMDDIDPISKMGVFVNNVGKLTMRNIHVKGAEGKTYAIDNIDEVDVDDTVSI